MTLIVHAPLGGLVIDLKEVPDPVFSGAVLGPGVAILPDNSSCVVEVCAPISGRVTAFHSHAFALGTEGEAPVLVHLGIDTVTLQGEGFTAFSSANTQVRSGDPLIAWDLSVARTLGLATVVPVIALSPSAHITALAIRGARVEAGSPLFSCS